SALPKEGKSFVAANLAQVLVRQHGRRALLVDGDLRGARLHTALGTDGTPGVSDYLLGEADEYAILQRGPMENLFFIGSGRSGTNPAELVANGRLKRASLAMQLGVKGIHIAERDTQWADVPKQADEFVNTWSIGGFLSEGLQPAELGWGTHEKHLPPE